MKKILLLTISVLCLLVLTLGLTGCGDKKQPVPIAYTLDTTAFNNVAVIGESLSLNGLKIVGTDGSSIPVTPAMVSGIDTNTAGPKSFTVTHGGQKFVATYTVKFRVVFVIEGVEYEQIVLFSDELVIPETPKVANKQFDRWSIQIPSTLMENLRIEAIYKTLSSEREDVYTWSGEGLINTEGYTEGSNVNISITDESGNPVTSTTASFDAATNKISYTLGAYDDNIVIAITGDSVTTLSKSWRIVRQAEPTLSIAGGQEAIGVYLGANKSSHKVNTGSRVPLRYTITGNSNVSVEERSGYLIVTPLNAGVTELTITATNATNELEKVVLTHYVVVMPEKLMISNDIAEYGLEDIWTVGKDNADRLQKLAAMISSSNIGIGFAENIQFVCDDSRVTITNDGKIALNTYEASTSIVNVKAIFGFKGMAVESDSMQIRCVFNGVNVYSYAELWTATNSANPQPIVLQNNIKDDFGRNYTTMQSTYDLTYYKNILGEGTEAYKAATEIKVLIQFKSNVYGNGYEINAHNATIGTLDSTGKPTDRTLFRGPLDFVAMSDNGTISVKGQDNIVFGVYEGVTLNNIVLKSCELTPNPETGKVDLTDLNFAGTTVEVLGDNVTIEYSRLMNGRTILRVFGDANDAAKPIHVTVKNTMIKASREFSARIGSNRLVDNDANVEDGANLPGDNGSDYNTKQSYNSMSADEKAAYDSKFINTFVTFENVIFEDAGIFAIGMDAHFAGKALADGSGYLKGILTGWKDLDKTSYGAKVTLKDDVRFYTWQPLENIDSSTLIENKLPNSNSWSKLSLNVNELVEYCSQKYPNIIYTDASGKKYVHVAIAFFGGGKNYCVVENSITSEFNPTLYNLQVKLSDLGEDVAIYETAAGKQPFYFMICDVKSGFTYDTQMNLPADTKYAILRKK